MELPPLVLKDDERNESYEEEIRFGLDLIARAQAYCVHQSKSHGQSDC